jgi:hypothetical protein
MTSQFPLAQRLKEGNLRASLHKKNKTTKNIEVKTPPRRFLQKNFCHSHRHLPTKNRLRLDVINFSPLQRNSQFETQYMKQWTMARCRRPAKRRFCPKSTLSTIRQRLARVWQKNHAASLNFWSNRAVSTRGWRDSLPKVLDGFAHTINRYAKNALLNNK